MASLFIPEAQASLRDPAEQPTLQEACRPASGARIRWFTDSQSLQPFIGAWDTLSECASEPNVFFESWYLLPALELLRGTADVRIDPDFKNLYAANEAYGAAGGNVSAYAIDLATGKLTKLSQAPSSGKGPCHVSTDASGSMVMVANYGNGSFASIPLDDNGAIKPWPGRKKGLHLLRRPAEIRGVVGVAVPRDKVHRKGG